MRVFKIAVFLVAMAPGAVAWALELPVGTVTASVLNVRRGPSLSEEAFWKLQRGEEVKIRDMEGEWIKVELPGTDRKLRGPKTGYVFMDYLDIQLHARVESKQGFRISPQRMAPENGVIGNGEWVQIVELGEGWSKVRARDGRLGWLENSTMSLPDGFLKDYRLAKNIRGAEEEKAGYDARPEAGDKAIVTQPTRSFSNEPAAPRPSGRAADILSTARGLRNTPYRYGGIEPGTGFDCSGFTSYVFAEHGVYLQRTADSQSREGTHVRPSDLQPGDLVFFGSTGRPDGSVNHVGIYVGAGDFIHAASSRASGSKVTVSNLEENYYKTHYQTARRVLP